MLPRRPSSQSNPPQQTIVKLKGNEPSRDKLQCYEGRTTSNQLCSNRTCCSSKAAAAQHAGNEGDRPPPRRPDTILTAAMNDPSLLFDPARLANPHAYLTPDGRNHDRQFVAPWSEYWRSTPQELPIMDECVCGDAPGQCTCIGCARHADNQATLDFVSSAWASQMADPSSSDPSSQVTSPRDYGAPGTFDAQFPDLLQSAQQSPLTQQPSGSLPQTMLQYPIPPAPQFVPGQSTVLNPQLMGWNSEDPFTSPTEEQYGKDDGENEYQPFAMVGPCPICLCGENCTCAGCPCHNQDAALISPTSFVPEPNETSCCGTCCQIPYP